MTDCVIWPLSRFRNGYGQATPDPGRTTHLAHRREWERAYGPVPAGMTLDHLCRNKACINVDHLEVVTMRENVLRSNNVCAQNARMSACSEGHPFDETNTYRYSGRRHCRVCRRGASRRYRAKQEVN